MIELGRLTGCAAGRLLKGLKHTKLPIEWPNEPLVRAWWKDAGLGKDRADTQCVTEVGTIRVHIAGLVMPSPSGRELKREVAMLYEPIYGTLFFAVAGSYNPALGSEQLDDFIHKSLDKLPASLRARISNLAFTTPSEPVDHEGIPIWYLRWRRPPKHVVHGKSLSVMSLPKTSGYERIRFDLLRGPAGDGLMKTLRSAQTRYNGQKFKILVGTRSPKGRMWTEGER
jgi:hypothetical protein